MLRRGRCSSRHPSFHCCWLVLGLLLLLKVKAFVGVGSEADQI